MKNKLICKLMLAQTLLAKNDNSNTASARTTRQACSNASNQTYYVSYLPHQGERINYGEFKTFEAAREWVRERFDRVDYSIVTNLHLNCYNEGYWEPKERVEYLLNTRSPELGSDWYFVVTPEGKAYGEFRLRDLAYEWGWKTLGKEFGKFRVLTGWNIDYRQNLGVQQCQILDYASCLQESDRSALLVEQSEDLEQLSSSKLTNRLKLFCNTDFQESPFTQILLTTLENLTPSTSLQSGSHAQEPQAPVKEPDSIIPPVISGGKLFESSNNAAPPTSSLKTQRELLIEDCDKCLGHSEYADIVLNLRKSYKQTGLVIPTEGSEYSSLPTPTTYPVYEDKRKSSPGTNKLEDTLLKSGEMERGEKLNPALVGAMMGFPPSWVEESCITDQNLLDAIAHSRLPELKSDVPSDAVKPSPSTPDQSFQPVQLLLFPELNTSIPYGEAQIEVLVLELPALAIAVNPVALDPRQVSKWVKILKKKNWRSKLPALKVFKEFGQYHALNYFECITASQQLGLTLSVTLLVGWMAPTIPDLYDWNCTQDKYYIAKSLLIHRPHIGVKAIAELAGVSVSYVYKLRRTWLPEAITKLEHRAKVA